jgi:hypothetical protein
MRRVVRIAHLRCRAVDPPSSSSVGNTGWSGPWIEETFWGFSGVLHGAITHVKIGRLTPITSGRGIEPKLRSPTKIVNGKFNTEALTDFHHSNYCESGFGGNWMSTQFSLSPIRATSIPVPGIWGVRG